MPAKGDRQVIEFCMSSVQVTNAVTAGVEGGGI